MFHIALNTFREIIRGKFGALLTIFSIIMIGVIFFFNTLSLDQSEFIIPDFGLSFIEIIGVFLILFLGNRMLSREFEEKTIYLTLSRPISRGKIILGKFLGFSGILALTTGILSTLLILLMIFLKVSVSAIFLISILGIFVKLLILLAVSLFFSIFLSSGIATFVTLAVYIIAHGGYTLLEYAIRSENTIFEIISSILLIFFPNFLALNFKSQIHMIGNIDLSKIIINIGLGLLYLTIILFISQYIFKKKNFDNI